MTKKLYIITGVNIMTGEREECSIPMQYKVAQELLLKELSQDRKDPAYTDLTIELYKDSQLYLPI